MFDPYREWLDIPVREQPPSHYRLLGIAPDEANLDAIKEAALLQTTRVRMYQTGPQAEVCTRILNEIAQARATLVNLNTRHEYDARLATQAARAPDQSVAIKTSASNSPLPWPRPDRLLAAVGFCCLLLFGFGISFCLTFQSVRTAAQVPAEKLDAERPPPRDGQP
jgi:hypothetical protein